MNKSELVSAVEKTTTADAKVVAEVIDATFSAVVRAVSKGESVTLTGFGVFENRKRAARVARNPRTGQVVKVRATKVPAFRPAPQFRAFAAGKAKLPKTGSVISRISQAAPAKAPVAKKVAPAKAPVAKKAAPAKAPVAKKAAPAKAPVAKKGKKGARKK